MKPFPYGTLCIGVALGYVFSLAFTPRPKPMPQKADIRIAKEPLYDVRMTEADAKLLMKVLADRRASDKMKDRYGAYVPGVE